MCYFGRRRRDATHALKTIWIFTEGDRGEEAAPTNLKELLKKEIIDDTLIYVCTIELKICKSIRVTSFATLKRQAPGRATASPSPMQRGSASVSSSASRRKDAGPVSKSTTTAPRFQRKSVRTSSDHSMVLTTRATSLAPLPRATAAKLH